MKKCLYIAAATVALFAANSASAQTQSITVNGQVGSKCGISAQSSAVTLATDLTGSDAKVRSAVTSEIATALNNANVIAFCNELNSKVKVERGVLSRVGASGTGVTGDGYAHHIRYGLQASIDGLFLDSTDTAGESNVASRFGGHVSASSAATHLDFAPSAAGAPVASSNGSSPTATNWSSLTDRRLAAGNYQGSVTITLTPGA